MNAADCVQCYRLTSSATALWVKANPHFADLLLTHKVRIDSYWGTNNPGADTGFTGDLWARPYKHSIGVNERARSSSNGL